VAEVVKGKVPANRAGESLKEIITGTAELISRNVEGISNE